MLFGECDTHAGKMLCLIAMVVLVWTGSTTVSCNHHAEHHMNHRWLRTEVMDGNGLYVLDWKVLGREIFFRITVNTRGFVGLGFSQKTGKMSNADLVMAWVDDRTGKPTVLVSMSKEKFTTKFCLISF